MPPRDATNRIRDALRKRGTVRVRWCLKAALVVLVLGCACSKSSNSSSPTTIGAGVGTSPTSAVATTRPSATTGTTAASTAGLSGRWAGDYQQTNPAASSGTFTIQWQQVGSAITGTITIPGTCPSGCAISATLNGSTISFGFVAGGAITYTGTVAGSSMSGTYSTADASTKGTWKATRSG